MLKEFVATYGYRGDQCHELLEVALRVAIGVQALHHAVQSRLVFDVLQRGGQTERSQVEVKAGSDDITFGKRCDIWKYKENSKLTHLALFD